LDFKVPDYIPSFEEDFSIVKGQEVAKRVLEISASGGHNVLILYKV